MSRRATIDFDAQIRQAELWLAHGRMDHAEARSHLRWSWISSRRSIVPVQAARRIYYLQQSVEKTSKSLMVAIGQDEHSLSREFNHNSLRAILRYLERSINHPYLHQSLDRLSTNPSLGVSGTGEALHALETLMKRTRKNRDYHELAVVPPDAMKVLTSLMAGLREQVLAKAREELPVRIRVKIDSSNYTQASPVEYLMDRVVAATNGILEPPSPETKATFWQVLDTMASDDLEEQLNEVGKLEVSVPRRLIIEECILPVWALPTLYLLAALTFPHAASTRYPTRLDAPSNPVQAASLGRLGTGHYSESLGIVRHFSELHRLAGLMLKSIRPVLIQANEMARSPEAGLTA